MRVVGLLICLAALVVALPGLAWGQATPTPTASQTPTATPTPTPSATPTPEPTPTPEEEKQARLRKRPVVKRVYRDFRRDGKIESCEHSRKALQRTLESVGDEFAVDFPDFRPAVKAAIKDWKSGDCPEAEAAPTATPSPSSTPAPTSTPSATPVPSTPTPSTDSGSIPAPPPVKPSKTPKPPKAKPSPPSEGDVTPVQPSPTPVPTAAPPPQEAQLVVTRPGSDPNLLVPALLLAVALAGLAIAGGTAAAARRGGSGHLAGWGHAWREAGYRASGAWSDFGDWLRLGR
jgi:hypothetical protein